MKSIKPAMAVLLLVTALGGCVINKYDDNLFTDDVWIAQEGDTYSYIRGIIEMKPLELTLDFSGFYGKHTVWVINAREESAMSAHIDLADELKGLYKICLISPDKVVTTLVCEPGNHQLTIPLSPGKQVITLVGYQASGNLLMQLSPPPNTGNVTIHEREFQ